jgi:hypothetical protein
MKKYPRLPPHRRGLRAVVRFAVLDARRCALCEFRNVTPIRQNCRDRPRKAPRFVGRTGRGATHARRKTGEAGHGKRSLRLPQLDGQLAEMGMAKSRGSIPKKAPRREGTGRGAKSRAWGWGHNQARSQLKLSPRPIVPRLNTKKGVQTKESADWRQSPRAGSALRGAKERAHLGDSMDTLGGATDAHLTARSPLRKKKAVGKPPWSCVGARAGESRSGAECTPTGDWASHLRLKMRRNERCDGHHIPDEKGAKKPRAGEATRGYIGALGLGCRN